MMRISNISARRGRLYDVVLMSKPPKANVRREPRANFGKPPPPPPPAPPTPAEAHPAPSASSALARRAKKGRQVRERRDARGKLIERYETRDGLLHGLRRVWAPSGQLLVETKYRMGQPHGLARTWNVHGRLVNRVTYRDGRHSGPFTTWWDNGQIKEQGAYLNGQRVGWYVWFDSDGTELGRYHYAEPAGRGGKRRRRKRGFLTRLARALGLRPSRRAASSRRRG